MTATLADPLDCEASSCCGGERRCWVESGVQKANEAYNGSVVEHGQFPAEDHVD